MTRRRILNIVLMCALLITTAIMIGCLDMTIEVYQHTDEDENGNGVPDEEEVEQE